MISRIEGIGSLDRNENVLECSRRKLRNSHRLMVAMTTKTVKNEQS